MGTKKGDEKFGHALHDGLTRSAIYKKMEQKAIEGNRRVHVSRRAWKYRIDDDENEKASYMQRCAYVSRRTQLACKNYRLPSQLTREGFCELHPRFFQQLAQQAEAEQRRIEKILLKKPDDMLSTAVDDETLMTVADWSCAQQELFNNLLLDDDDDDLLKNAEVWTDEEVLRYQLVALERKLCSIREFRRLIAEKARRLAVIHAKMEEDPKKSKPKVIRDRRTQEIQLANKRYHSSHAAKDQYMSRRLKARLEWDGSEEHKFDYLKVDDVEGAQCTYFFSEAADIRKGDQSDNLSGTDSFEKGFEEDPYVVVRCLVESLCEQVAKALDCGKEPSECAFNTENEARGKKRHQCSNSSIPKSNLCIKHIYNDSRQRLFARCIECDSLGLDFGDGWNYCLTHMAKREHNINEISEHWETRTVQQGVIPVSNIYAIKGTLPAEQVRNPAKSNNVPKSTAVSASGDGGNIGDGSKETAVKFVVIDEGIDDEDGIGVKTSTPTIGTMKHPADAFMQPGISTHRSWQEEEIHSCARTRPFTTENFNKSKMRRGIGVRYSLPDVKDYLSGDLLSSSVYRSQEQLSKSIVHDLLSGGPSKVAASASQLASRRIVTPETSFTQKIATRRNVYSPTTGSRSNIEAPEMISLASASGATTSVSTGLTPSKPIIQRPIVLRSRSGTSSALPGQPSRLPPTSTNRYVATVGVSRPVQNYRNRATISLDSRIRRAVNVISPMDYSNRPGNNSSTSRVIPGSYFRQRDERQFVSGNARSRLVAIDSLPYTAPRVYSRPSQPPPTFRPEIPRPVVYRPRVAPERKAPLTAETLETAAAVASIAADLEASEDKEDEADEMIGRLETPAWQRSITERPTANRDFISEHRAVTGSGGRIMRSEAAGSSTKQSVTSLSRQSSGESAEDGLAVLAMAAASRAVDSDQSQPPLKKSKLSSS